MRMRRLERLGLGFRVSGLGFRVTWVQGQAISWGFDDCIRRVYIGFRMHVHGVSLWGCEYEKLYFES